MRVFDGDVVGAWWTSHDAEHSFESIASRSMMQKGQLFVATPKAP